MQISFSKIFKRNTRLSALHKEVLNAKYYWSVCAIVFITLSVAGAVVGALLFRSIYLEKYKKDLPAEEDVLASMRINALKRSIEKRNALINSETKIAPDPSL